MDECCKLFASCLENQRCVKKFTVIYLQAVRVPLLPSRQKISQKSENLKNLSQKIVVFFWGGDVLNVFLSNLLSICPICIALCKDGLQLTLGIIVVGEPNGLKSTTLSDDL